MTGRRLSRWVLSVLRRWFPRPVSTYRRPVARYAKPMLTVLEERFSPTSLSGSPPVQLAPATFPQTTREMPSTTEEARKDHEKYNLPDSSPLRLLSTPPAKPDDRPIRAETQLPELTIIFGSPRAEQQEAELNDLFRQRAERPKDTLSNPPHQQGQGNSANPQARAGSGGGGGGGGASTPNAAGGGGSAVGGGSGTGVTNASQFLTAYLNMVGSALNLNVAAPTQAIPAGQVAAAAPPNTSAPLAPLTAPAQTAKETTISSRMDSVASTSSLVSSTLSSVVSSTFSRGQTGSDPLYVLDMNTGETVPANVTLNSFSTWSENLLAQVSGATVTSYSWDLSKAPDLTNISGQSTANLQGSWASFTGAARTDTIVVTETAQGGTQLSQTIVFQVSGTDSPAYASTRPTSNTTWPSVVTPDQLSTGQASVSAGPYASLGLTDGSVQTSFALPSYNPNVSPTTLVYNSTVANAQPIFLVHYQLPTGQAVPATITAQLTLNGTAGAQIVYDTSALNPGDWVQIALQGNATGLSTGRYPWQITITNGSTTTYSGNVDIVNRASSPYGAGWWLDDLEQLVSVSGGMMLVNADGTSLFFASNGPGGFTTPAGDFSTLVQNQDGSYTRTLSNGTKINFSSSGQQTSIVDRDGNTTSFGYTSGQLATITDMNSQVTTLAYNAGLLSSITDPANRVTALAYTGTQLTSITDAASKVWQYAYDASNRLTTETDPRLDATTFTYNAAGRIASVTRADNTTEQLTAEQMNGLAAPGTGTVSNPAPAVLLATGDQAQYTDPRNHVWTTGFDWLGFGLPVLSADPLGDTALAYRDTNGLAWLSADPLARRSRSFFDNQGNATKIVHPDDGYAQYSYNSFSEPTQYIDPVGDITTYTYNTKGDLTQIIVKPSANPSLTYVTSFAYNAQGLVTSKTDPLHHTTSYGYNALNELTSTTNALSQTTTYGYNSAGRATSVTDGRGFTSTYAYDALNRLIGKTLADTSTTNSVYTFGYDAVGNQTSVTDPLTHLTQYSYDKLNRLSSITDALNETSSYGYDAAGNQTSVTDPLIQTTSYSFDAANRLISVTNALNQTSTFGYDAAGEKTSQTNALNQTTTYSYTLLGQVATITDPLSNVVSYTYNAAGDTLSITQSGPSKPSETTTLGYDGLHEETSSTDPLNHATTYGYDADGNMTSATDPLNHATTYGYNALNQLVSVTDPLNNQTTYGYDADGNRTSVTDPLLRTTSFSFDAQGRLLSQTDPRNGTTTYGYNLTGLLTSLTDPDNNTTTYGYDAVNRKTSETDPLGHATTYAYNAGGLLTAMTDRDGRTIDYGYDALDRLTSETWVGGNYTATYGYDAAGNLTSASDPFSTYSYNYNAASQLTGVDNLGTPGVPHVILTYGYDVYGNRTSLTDSLGGSLSWSYDSLQRLTNIALSLNGTTAANVALSYDESSRLTNLTRSTPTGDTISTSIAYDNAGRMIQLGYSDASLGRTLANYTYGYDAAEQLTSYGDTNSSLTYVYDAGGELTSASGTLNGSGYSVSYSYDANGNRNMSGYSTGTGNRLASDGVYNYTYDNEGNTLTQTEISTGSVTYFTWDYRNRLTEVQVKDSLGSLLQDEKFTYDVNNNRIGTWLNGSQQLWTVFDGANPYMDFNGGGTLTQRYLTNPDSLSEFYGQVNASGTVQWFLTDNINSISQVVSTSGTPLDAITYDPYGNIVSQANAANAPRLMYAGGAVDSLTGNYQYNARYYSSTDGRFVSEDPLAFEAGDTNLYRYTFNTPTYNTDPSGEIIGIVVIGGILVLSAAAGYATGVAISGGRQSVNNIATSVAYDTLGIGGRAGGTAVGLEGIKHIPSGKRIVAPGQRIGTTIGNRIQVRYGGRPPFWGTKNVSGWDIFGRTGKLSGALILYTLAWSLFSASYAESQRLNRDRGIGLDQERGIE